MGLRNTQYAIRNTFTFYALAAITLMGLAVRLWDLTNFGVWFDEAYHVQLVRLPMVGDMLNAVLSNPPSDPLYVLLLRPWVALFGHGDGRYVCSRSYSAQQLFLLHTGLVDSG